MVAKRLLGATLVALSLGLPARAADPPPAQVRGADRPHPDAAKINQANSRVIHAGPGTPITGAIFTPSAAGKKDKKN